MSLLSCYNYLSIVCLGLIYFGFCVFFMQDFDALFFNFVALTLGIFNPGVSGATLSRIHKIIRGFLFTVVVFLHIAGYSGLQYSFFS